MAELAIESGRPPLQMMREWTALDCDLVYEFAAWRDEQREKKK
jgi:hypothetical protein